ncbi:MAG: glycoside hydrolase family 32 protein, partial [Coprobacillus sp.]
MVNLTNIEIKQLEKQSIQDQWRLHYHLMPPTGWLNDPNGLCQMNGIYHIFYQYSPDNCFGGKKYWGHYTTKDFITYENCPIPLFPDNEYDRDGVYSGSAFVKDGKMYAYYTGNVKHQGDYDYIHAGRGHNTILTTSMDGIHFGEKQCLLENKDYPKDLTCHVRDPQVIEKDGRYYMILGARQSHDVGCCLLYKSHDLYNWEFVNRIQSDEPFGYMWECPNLVELDHHMIMLCCPQGVEQEGYKYENLYQNGYYIITGDIESDYKLSQFMELDYGFDFYAPQLFKDENNRTIMIGWMGLPDVPYQNPTTNNQWQHALTLPRELTFKNGVVYQYPIEETKNLRLSQHELVVSNQQSIIETTCFEMNIVIDNQDFQLSLRNDVQLIYENNILTLKLGESGYGRDERHIEV